MIVTMMFYIDLKKNSINVSSINTIIFSFINIVVIIDLYLKHVMLNNVIIYDKSKTAEPLIQLFNEY